MRGIFEGTLGCLKVFRRTKLHTNIADIENSSSHPQGVLEGGPALWIGRFEAMASDCEVLIEHASAEQALELFEQVMRETWRIEHKFSRYRDDNVVHRINASYGEPLTLDQETSALLDFADQCYQLSAGLFDITSGAYRRIWRFDGGERVPSADQIEQVRAQVGWDRVTWNAPVLSLPGGMELDLGGLGKEYAVDRALLIAQQFSAYAGVGSCLINFGGDLACTGPRSQGGAWVVGVESAKRDATAVASVQLSGGAVATSGDARRFVMHRGKKLPHIINPNTGWPVAGAPSAVSVAGANCMQAGMLSTIAMLHGGQARSFLDSQGVQYWLQS